VSPEPHLMTTAAMLAVSRHQTSSWRMAHYDHPKNVQIINARSWSFEETETPSAAVSIPIATQRCPECTAQITPA
jgi:hypothetical protein